MLTTITVAIMLAALAAGLFANHMRRRRADPDGDGDGEEASVSDLIARDVRRHTGRGTSGGTRGGGRQAGDVRPGRQAGDGGRETGDARRGLRIATGPSPPTGRHRRPVRTDRTAVDGR